LIGYFPTWRDTGMDKFMGAATTEDISALNALLEKYNALLITKWHSCSYVEYQHRGISQTAAEIDQTLAQSSHIMALPFLCDLNTVLDCCSMLISDYSGVLIDYLLLQRPIIQIPYDQEEYKNFTGVLPDYEQFSTEAGPLTKSFSQLLNQLERYLSHSDDWEKEYKLRQENLENYYFSTKESMTKLEHLLQPVQ
jgi:CDP-glycerol glycerophosphotransferase